LNLITLLVLLGVTLVLGIVFTVMIIWHLGKHDRAVRARIAEARKAGRHETLSLHPVVDEGKCIGCEECVRGCPEEDVLLTFRNKAVVVDAAECVGHGLCERVCPVGAITLVMGTATRGVEIPRLTEFFETSVPGMYVVGELGGMGLIRNAIWQATQAVEHAASAERTARDDEADLLIVGAGPAGLAAALTAQQSGLRYRVIEQEAIGGAMMQYPRRKLVMTYPAALPGVGEFPFKEVEKEPLLAFWKKAIADHGITIQEGARLEKVERTDGGFLAHTSAGPIRAVRIVLALGRRGTPRKLGVPGEDRPNVTYRLLEPEQFQGMHVAVVGGGNAAVEAAMSLSAVPDTKVTLLHRDVEFKMARAVLVKAMDARAAKGGIEVLRQARLTAVEEGRVQVEVNGVPAERPNDFVFVMIGGTAPYALLTASGVDLEKKFGTPLLSPK
jgi:thioredoxin reductase/Pyruvate/2-oxoacid:ferredoxin oxidoreductase delta subunit